MNGYRNHGGEAISDISLRLGSICMRFDTDDDRRGLYVLLGREDISTARMGVVFTAMATVAETHNYA